MLRFGIVGYGLVALAYCATALILFASRPGRRRAALFVAAVGASGLWAGVTAVLIARDRLSLEAIAALDAAHLFLWTIAVLSWLPASRTNRALTAVSALAGVWAVVAAWPDSPVGGSVYSTLVGIALLGLLAVEQVFRNADSEQRKGLRLLCLACGGMMVLDLFVYSQAALLGAPVLVFWAARGFASLALLPLIIMAIKRQSGWERALFVSRQVVFYTTSLLGVGSYLLLLGVVWYAMRAAGKEWTFALEAQFLLVAIAVLFYVLFGSALRMRVRTFLVKHFYRNKYDYRQEWLRLTQSLSRSGDLRLIASSGLEALAQIVGARHGHLWLARDRGPYEWMASTGEDKPEQLKYDADHPIVRFLATRSWVIDSEEYGDEPDRYETAFGDASEAVLPRESIIVPLDCQGSLQGFVELDKRNDVGALNFEDHDILKTAGKQVAIALAQALALEKLAETRQFEAMNKMSTFLMHDLKNIIAQQQLVVSNAARFRQRPEFFDDAIATIRGGVERMRRVLEQIQGARPNASAGRTNVSKVLMEVRSHCADRVPIPDVDCQDTSVCVLIDREKLTSVLTHLVRNAQDATPKGGSVRISVAKAGRVVVCSIVDTGCGMDQGFIRDRLFRPFDSTKGALGMGIGAYQVRDIVRAAGGDVDVASAPSVGTTFRLTLPLAESPVGSQREAIG
jgi:putative PEP-CTERM system histidine kinase